MNFVIIDNLNYYVNNNEFTLKNTIKNFENLKIFNDISYFDILFGIITDISNELSINNFIHINPTHGGYLLCKLDLESNFINKNYFFCENIHKDNLIKNFKNHNIHN